MRTLIAIPTETPRLLSRICTPIVYDVDGTRLYTFFVTHFYGFHRALIRHAYRNAIQVAFRYY